MKFRRVLVTLLLLMVPSSTLAATFGVGGYINSEPNKSLAASKLNEIGANITRSEIPCSKSGTDWAPHDIGIDLAVSNGVQNLILLTNGNNCSVSEWGAFVLEVVNRYKGKVVAYEIYNEADNFISGNDYASYLSEAYDKIKGVDFGVKVIVAGLTARSEATNFWQGIYNAGAWNKFDSLGLHPYRYVAPEVVNYNIGDFSTSIMIAANFIRSKGGGKGIWITEFGYKSSQFGGPTQANFLGRSFVMAATIPEVEKVMMYRLRDNGESWGMLNSDYSNKESFDIYKNFVRHFNNLGVGERIFIYDKDIINSFNDVNGWSTEEKSNGSASLSTGDGTSGSGLKVDFNFNGDGGYVTAKKEISLSGTPVGLGIWAKGPYDSNVVKLRIKDSQGETFQFDMGKTSSNWNFYKFEFNSDVAKVSWGGNGNIDYPIKFESIVYEHQGGSSSGSLNFDELISIKDGADLYVYKFGSRIAYWKQTGSKATTACGKELNFTETPQYTDVSSCDSWESQAPAPAGSGSSGSVSSASKNYSASKKTIPISKSNPKVEFEKERILADGKEPETIKVSLGNDKLGNSKLTAEISGENNTVGNFELVDKTYVAKITSTKAQEKKIIVKLDNKEIASKTVYYDPGPINYNKSYMTANKEFSQVGEEVELELHLVDEFGNTANNTDITKWDIFLDEGTTNKEKLTIIKATNEFKKTKINFLESGKVVIGAKYDNNELKKRLDIYGLNTADAWNNPDSVYTISLGKGINIVGNPGQIIGIVLDGDINAEYVIIKIGDQYYYLKKGASGKFEGQIKLPEKIGSYAVKIIYKIGDKEETYAQGVIKVAEENKGMSLGVLIGSGIVLLIISILLIIKKTREKILLCCRNIWEKIRSKFKPKLN